MRSWLVSTPTHATHRKVGFKVVIHPVVWRKPKLQSNHCKPQILLTFCQKSILSSNLCAILNDRAAGDMNVKVGACGGVNSQLLAGEHKTTVCAVVQQERAAHGPNTHRAPL